MRDYLSTTDTEPIRITQVLVNGFSSLAQIGDQTNQTLGDIRSDLQEVIQKIDTANTTLDKIELNTFNMNVRLEDIYEETSTVAGCVSNGKLYVYNEVTEPLNVIGI